ncbi:tripartite tricarboxylate transporter substrate binding protein [Variovorax dokdonensis]|uniref:Tripartite tricarboxylate transporter substrate binding protein n=1 Tax=Variovorax dokdonensis TaxID=344883 RepID=A0ABT7NDN8_9BURK|nr:tripartite tricarboxylate transporter substrate binding protein [Variovorax dokdonensis]MDM0046062.1 tripartite tricarboxylate transporter substrate binding protein [Variovorax dokdonensis]
MSKRILLKLLAISALGSTMALPLAARADTPLKILVGFPPGGSADTIARIVADGMKDDFSAIVVENRPGAAGRIALTALKNSPPDGHTVIILPNGPMVLFPHLYKSLPYDPTRDFTPISELARFQFGVVSGPAADAGSIAELVAKAKADPDSATYGSAGTGTVPHLLGTMFAKAAGIQMRHIPFQGSAPANTALLGGHIRYKFDVVAETAELHRTGKVRILAVTGPKRDPQVPDVPTLREAGVDMQATAWFAMYAPAGLPEAVRQRLETAVNAALQRSATRDKLVKLGFEPVGEGSAALAAQQKADLELWGRTIKDAGIPALD